MSIETNSTWLSGYDAGYEAGFAAARKQFDPSASDASVEVVRPPVPVLSPEELIVRLRDASFSAVTFRRAYHMLEVDTALDAILDDLRKSSGTYGMASLRSLSFTPVLLTTGYNTDEVDAVLNLVAAYYQASDRLDGLSIEV